MEQSPEGSTRCPIISELHDLGEDDELRTTRSADFGTGVSAPLTLGVNRRDFLFLPLFHRTPLLDAKGPIFLRFLGEIFAQQIRLHLYTSSIARPVAEVWMLLFSETDPVLDQPATVFGSCFCQNCPVLPGLTLCPQAYDFPQNLR